MTFARLISAWTCCLFLLLLSGCEKAPTMALLSGATMGTTWNVSLADPLSPMELGNLRKDLQDELDRINRLMSTWDPESELSRFNRIPVGQAMTLAPETLDVLRMAQRISMASNGAFDITVGPLVNLWGFGPEMRPEEIPDAGALAAAFEQVGFRKLRIDADTATREVDLYVDLSAIAKGFAVDQLAALLQKRELRNFLVEVGGELRAHGRKPDGSSWRIGIEAPDTARRRARRVLRVQDTGMATSGDYRNYFESDGKRFSHTIDSATGHPIKHRLASVTVLDPSAARADAWATALMVLGPEKGMETARKQNLAAFFIIRKENGFVEQFTAPFAHYLESSS